MEGFMQLFGGGKGKAKESAKNAIIGLREQLKLLQKRETQLQNQIDEQHAIARKNITTNKAAAKKALERKKVHEGYRAQVEGHINTIQQQILAIESANINRETLAAMEQASAATGQIHGKLTPDKVEETMDKLREQNALSEEIAQSMNDINIGREVDEDDLEAEWEELQQEQVNEQMLKLGTVSVPDAIEGMTTPISGKGFYTPATTEEEEEEELRQLQAEMV